MSGRLVSVGVDIVVRDKSVPLRVIATSVQRAVEIAQPLDEGDGAQLRLPIDPRRFFVGGPRPEDVREDPDEDAGEGRAGPGRAGRDLAPTGSR